jgi:hypothetical protein
MANRNSSNRSMPQPRSCGLVWGSRSFIPQDRSVTPTIIEVT